MITNDQILALSFPVIGAAVAVATGLIAMRVWVSPAKAATAEDGTSKEVRESMVMRTEEETRRLKEDVADLIRRNTEKPLKENEVRRSVEEMFALRAGQPIQEKIVAGDLAIDLRRAEILLHSVNMAIASQRGPNDKT